MASREEIRIKKQQLQDQKDEIVFQKFKDTRYIQIVTMSNRQLLEETIEAAKGDDYDGCFSKQGQWEFENLQKELEKRLENWLKED